MILDSKYVRMLTKEIKERIVIKEPAACINGLLVL